MCLLLKAQSLYRRVLCSPEKQWLNTSDQFPVRPDSNLNSDWEIDLITLKLDKGKSNEVQTEHNTKQDTDSLPHSMTEQAEHSFSSFKFGALPQRFRQLRSARPLSVHLSNSKFPYLTVSNYLLSSTDQHPNAFGCKIKVPSKLNIDKWCHYLADYPNKEICNFLQYGWPINYTSQTEPNLPTHNHSFTCFYKQIIDDYVSLEMTENATEGPYDPGTKLFVKPIHSVPLMTVPKKGSTNKRWVILDFSYPEGRSVNDSIPKDTYLGETFHLCLPCSAQFIDIINFYRCGCLLFKADLK